MKLFRLMFIPEKHFDSFTIKNILENTESIYVYKYIDSNINKNIRKKCEYKLKKYDTTINEDKLALIELKEKRKNIIERIEKLESKPFSQYNPMFTPHNNPNYFKEKYKERQLLAKALNKIERENMVLEYKIREKSFYKDCQILELFSMDYDEIMKTYKKLQDGIDELTDALENYTNLLNSVLNEFDVDIQILDIDGDGLSSYNTPTDNTLQIEVYSYIVHSYDV